MLNFKKIDAKKGPLLPSLIVYAFPLILSTIVQTLFSAVDLTVLANMADTEAMASVGATTTITYLIVYCFIGLSAGAKILLARYIGAEENEKIQQTVHTSLISSTILGVLVAIIGIQFAPDLLQLIDCPKDCFDGAVLYVRIYVLAAPFILFYNFGSSILTAAGDTQRPFYYIVVSGIFNCMLNILLCLLLPNKVAAVAISTAVSQILSAALTANRLGRIDLAVRVDWSRLHWTKQAFGKILHLGLPLCLTQILFPLANMQMQTAVNSYGISAVAGSSASDTLEVVASAFTTAFATTASVFIGQNIGAKHTDRAKKSFVHCLWLSAATGLAVGLLFTLTADFWFSFLLPEDPDAVSFAKIRLLFILVYWFVGICHVMTQTIQALGGTTYSAINSIVCVFGLRIVWMNTVYAQHPTFIGIVNCFVASWILMFFTDGSALIFYYRRFQKGKIKEL